MVIVAILERPVIVAILTYVGLDPRQQPKDRPGESMLNFAGEDARVVGHTLPISHTAARQAESGCAPSRQDAAIEALSPSTSSRLEPAGAGAGHSLGPCRGRAKSPFVESRMKTLALSVAVLAFMVPFTPSAFAVPDDTDLGFETAFYRPFYKTSSFGLVVTGTAIVAAGTFSYFTAGAGAPAAATGVSTVASWVAGGGAGSYMAGLSTIGGWFGGNAMLGSAILNGISLGTVGGMGSWGTLSSGQKALALGATAATTMDGIAIIS